MEQYVKAISINDFMAVSYVDRYHTEHTNRTQSVAEHSFRVALLSIKMLHALYILHPDLENRYGTTDKLELDMYRYALLHDIDEVNGDVPSQVKRYLREQGVDVNPILHSWYWGARGLADNGEFAVNPFVKYIVSLADSLEGAMFGNAHIPSGPTKLAVMEDWNNILSTKMNKAGDVGLEVETVMKLYETISNSIDMSLV